MTDAPVLTQLKPLNIGNIRIDTPLFLAPMAGQTNYPLRALCREIGDTGMVCTELISSDAMQYKEAKARALAKFDFYATEKPVGVQLFGGDPYVMAEAAKIVQDYGADIVDINMGCWVPKIARTGGGAVLLKDVCAATAVVEAVVKAVSIPVTVKIRTGWERAHPTAVPFAKAAEDCGVAAVAVHARFASQGFKGEPDWDVIRQVKDAVRHIPVIGNGDVVTPADAQQMLAQTGCDGVMIGRAAISNPWIFRHIAHTLRTGETLPDPTPQERAHVAKRHIHYMLQSSQRDDWDTVNMLKRQLIGYFKDVKYASRLREYVANAKQIADFEMALDQLAG